MYNQLLITLQLEDKMVYFYIIFWYTFMLLFTLIVIQASGIAQAE